jgi:hypothetical protein
MLWVSGNDGVLRILLVFIPARFTCLLPAVGWDRDFATSLLFLKTKSSLVGRILRIIVSKKI